MRMIELAFEEKARVLEQEVRGLREYSQERQSQLTLMERRAGELEGQLREAEQRQRDLAAENASLNAEKSQLSHELPSSVGWWWNLVPALHVAASWHATAW